VKPPGFAYHAPETVAETVELLSTHENARLLAGGQSLMPMLNMRFAFPDHLIDLNRVAGLAGITVSDGEMRIGAMTRQRDLLDSDLVRRYLPLMSEALTHVGHRQTRNRGTIGGSLCHMDPAAELVSVAAALDAVIDITGPNGSRSLPMAEFPLGYMTPAIAPDEMVTAIRIALPPRHGHCFLEFSRRHGDFAIVSAAAMLTLDEAGRIATASLTLGGLGPVPVRMAAAEAVLRGAIATPALLAEAAAHFANVEAMEDAQVPAWYRQHLAAVLARRALITAHERLVAMVEG
jgi:carbon-monoxide dehydrogenase medium subunit